MDHTYQAFSAVLTDGRKIGLSSEFRKEIQAENSLKDPVQSFEHFQKWMNIRMGDISAVMDDVLQGTKLSCSELIDHTNICVMGHSLGGSAALGMSRIRDDIRCVISLEAPYMYDIEGVSEKGKFNFNTDPYPVPVLHIYSDSAYPHLREWKQYAANVQALQDQEHV